MAEAAGVETRSLFLPWVEMPYTSLIRLGPEGLDQALAHIGRALRFAPDDHVLHRHALLLALAGKAAEATRTWRLACALHPGYAESLAPLLGDFAAREAQVAALLADAAP